MKSVFPLAKLRFISDSKGGGEVPHLNVIISSKKNAKYTQQQGTYSLITINGLKIFDKYFSYNGTIIIIEKN